MPGKLFVLILLLTACTEKKAHFSDCGKGIGEACNQAGIGMMKNYPAKAKDFFKKACDLANADGCVRYGEIAEKSDPDGALAAYGIACDKGNAEGCTHKATLLGKNIN